MAQRVQRKVPNTVPGDIVSLRHFLERDLVPALNAVRDLVNALTPQVRLPIAELELQDPAGGTELVLVQTLAPNWLNGSRIILPVEHTAGSRVTVKDAEGNAVAKNIVVDANGNAIDGVTTVTINNAWDTLDLVSDGEDWLVL